MRNASCLFMGTNAQTHIYAHIAMEKFLQCSILFSLGSWKREISTSQRSSPSYSENTTWGKACLAKSSKTKQKSDCWAFWLTLQFSYIDVLMTIVILLLLQDSQQENCKSLSFGEQSILGRYCIGGTSYTWKQGIESNGVTYMKNTYRQRRGHRENRLYC